MQVIDNRYAVVMADLVKSGRASSAVHLHRQLNDAVDHANRCHAASIASPLTITLGDEFQGLVTSLGAAATIVRNLRLRLMADAVECRFVIGYVELATPLNPTAAWNMMGLGLSAAREKLDQKRATSLYRFSLQDVAAETTLEALGAGLTSIERRWTAQQHADITAFIAGATPADIAARRNVTVHSVYKVRSSGDFDAYMMLWHAVGETLAWLDRDRNMA